MRYTNEPIDEVIRGVRTSVSGIGHHACDKCGNYVLDGYAIDALCKEQLRQIAEAKGLMSPSEIRALRKSLGMRQAEFEKLLGVSPPTVSRWETSAVLQTRTADILMRLIRARPELVHVLRNLD